MGTSTSVAQFSAKIAHAADAIATVTPNAVRNAGKAAEPVMTGTVAAMVGPDLVARNTPAGRPSTMGARMVPVSGGTVARVRIIPRGPVPLIDQGSPGHLIGIGHGSVPTAGGKRTRRTVVAGLGRAYNLDRDSTALRVGAGDEWRTGPFIHPGTRGKHKWTPTRDRVLPPMVQRIIHRENMAALTAVFR